MQSKNDTQKMIIFSTFYYNAFPMHVLKYVVVSWLCLHVEKFCNVYQQKTKRCRLHV